MVPLRVLDHKSLIRAVAILVKMATILLGLSVGPANLTTLGVVTLPAAHYYSVLSCWERTMHL